MLGRVRAPSVSRSPIGNAPVPKSAVGCPPVHTYPAVATPAIQLPHVTLFVIHWPLRAQELRYSREYSTKDNYLCLLSRPDPRCPRRGRIASGNVEADKPDKADAPMVIP